MVALNPVSLAWRNHARVLLTPPWRGCSSIAGLLPIVCVFNPTDPPPESFDWNFDALTTKGTPPTKMGSRITGISRIWTILCERVQRFEISIRRKRNKISSQNSASSWNNYEWQTENLQEAGRGNRCSNYDKSNGGRRERSQLEERRTVVFLLF